MKNFRANQRDCPRKSSYCGGKPKLNYLLIGLELAHEKLKNVKTFEPNKAGKGKKSAA